MREFIGTYYRSPDDEIRNFVRDTVDAGKTSFTDINGIRLIANPKRIKDPAQFADELIWTFDMVNRDRGVLPIRRTYVNQVPVLQRLAKRKLREFKKLDLLDFRAIIRWLLDVAPATHCARAWPINESKRVATKIEDWHIRRGNEFFNPAKPPALPPEDFQEADKLIRAATISLSSHVLGYLLTTGWIKDARQWIRRNG